MKVTTWLGLLIAACLVGPAAAQAPPSSAPPISLFDSVERIRRFLEDEAKQDYSDKYLSGISLHYFDGHPRKGLAWVYAFASRRPQLGGGVSTYHFMDGEIVEFRHGP
jgi:hypothetical protein